MAPGEGGGGEGEHHGGLLAEQGQHKRGQRGCVPGESGAGRCEEAQPAPQGQEEKEEDQQIGQRGVPGDGFLRALVDGEEAGGGEGGLVPQPWPGAESEQEQAVPPVEREGGQPQRARVEGEPLLGPVRDDDGGEAAAGERVVEELAPFLRGAEVAAELDLNIRIGEQGHAEGRGIGKKAQDSQNGCGGAERKQSAHYEHRSKNSVSDTGGPRRIDW
jgi:hypothetical protein